jgi:type IV pilus assembly protein PilM
MSELSLGLDIGSHSIKAVLLRQRGGRVQVLHAGSAQLEELGHMEDTPRKLTKEALIIRHLLRRLGIRRVPARISVSGRKSIIRYTRVPPAPEWRLKMLIEYEIEGDTENASKDLAYDFRLLDLPTSEIEFTVMMAMAKNDLVEDHCEILEDAGCGVDTVTLSPIPVFNTYLHNRGAAVEDDKTTLLVDVGSENLNIVIERNGRLFFARNISPAGRAFTEAVQDEFRLPFDEAERLKCEKGRLLFGGESSSADDTLVSPSADAPTEAGPSVNPDSPTEAVGLPGMLMPGDAPELSTSEPDQTAPLSEAMLPVAGRLASAIQSSLMYCRAQTRLTDLEIDEMVVTGGGAKLPGLRQALGRRLGVPVAPADPLKGFDLVPLPRGEREELESNAEAYATAIGLAVSRLEPRAVNFSLLPRRLKERRRFLTRTLYLWLAGAAMLAAVAVLGYSSLKYTGELRDHVNQKEAKLAANKTARAGLDRLLMVNQEYAGEVGLMQNYYMGPRQMLKAFGALKKHVPPEVEFISFKATSKGDRLSLLVDGIVLKRVTLSNGQEVRVDEKAAHKILTTLHDNLRDDPAFDPPPGDRPITKHETLKEHGNSIAQFTLELRTTRDNDDTSMGRE